ncbi:MAG: alpha/beta hydrolase family protein [Ilumatobacteraceae bacterium]
MSENRSTGAAERPYGTWSSEISARALTVGTVKLIDVWVDPTSDSTVWLEGRPSEAGRQVLVVRAADGTVRDLLPVGFNARSAVHEYGGGAAWVEQGRAWFVNWDDQRIWTIAVDGSDEPRPLTRPEASRSVRFADIRPSTDLRWLVAVRERHVDDIVTNEIVLLDASVPGEPVAIHAGHDFVMSPRFAALDRIRFVAWNHPNMPWDDTSLIECAFDPATGRMDAPQVVASGASFMQPVGDSVISDRSGWWNLWRVTPTDETPITDQPHEIGGPAWVFGLRDHECLDDGRRVWATGGHLVIDHVAHHVGAAVEQVTASPGAVTAIVRSTHHEPRIIRFDADDPTRRTVLLEPGPTPLPPDDVSVPERIEFATPGGGTAFAWFYPPTNTRFVGTAGTLPPLITMIHGGPTGAARPWFSMATQFWTNRGFAVVDVDHRGSTGYGTAYRRLLDGNWGIVDVEDCLAAAGRLAQDGLVDPRRMVVRGSSAGGFTVLACLAAGDVFAAGSCSYGIADLSILAADTHKFESHYTDRLIGPWPEARDVYESRSPIRSLERFDAPLIVFQGADDRVVPPSQSELIVSALRERGIDCEYHLYEGEGHGFRRADTIEHQLTAELAFYRRVLRLDRTDDVS